jgi:hypothetical protein
MKIFIYVTGLILSYLFYGFYLSQLDDSIIPLELKPENPSGYYDYRGVINVQTSRASGSASPAEVIDEAKSAGLDFLMLTDQNQQIKNSNFDANRNGVLVFEGSEYSFLDSRILLVPRSKTELEGTGSDITLQLTDLLSQKISAHPDQLVLLARPFNPGQTWTGPYPTGLDGVEILNPKRISKVAWDNSRLSVFWSFLIYPFNSRVAFLRLFREPLDEVSLWNSLSLNGKTVGYAGADANARAIPLADYPVRFPSYTTSFGIFNNHVLLKTELTGSYHADREKIFTAIKTGQFYFSLDILGNPKGFVATLVDHEETHAMGARVKFSRGMKIETFLPIKPKNYFEIVLYKDGDRVSTSNLEALNYEITGPGVYRVAVRVSLSLPFPDGKHWFTWIYTNPFYIY